MLLKSIDLLGFKSFADKTHLTFSEGVTALLGPNGCGKSNILDAVKWVLGEQSSKSLRADKMEDIIFNGAESRKSLSVAEVTMTLSNEEEQLPLAAPEISIKRRLYRSGESEYFINNLPALLREIRELFFDTGVGKSTYSIMEQGRIEQILSTRPEDRRLVFEEAAGITKYLIRGAEAARKLEKTRQNMRQIEGIRGEVKRSYDVLQRQAQRTERYRSLQERIFNSELETQLLRLRSLLERKADIETRLEDKSGQHSVLKEKIDQLRSALEQDMDLVNSMESRLVENQNRVYRIGLERNNKKSQVKILRERSLELERKIASEEERAVRMRSRIAANQQELRQGTDKLETLKSQLEDVGANIQGFQRDIEQFEAHIRENEGVILRLRRESEALEQDIESQRVELRRITEDIVTQLDGKLKDLGYSTQARQRLEGEINALLESVKIQLSGKSAILLDLERLENTSRRREDQVLASVRTLFREVLEKIDHLNELFGQYKQITPSFLEEFLAPEGIITQKRSIDGKIAQLQDQVLKKRQRAGELQSENKSLGVKIKEYRQTLERLRVNQAQMNTQKLALESEVERLKREIAEREAQLGEVTTELALTRQRLNEIQGAIDRLKVEGDQLEREEKKVQNELASLKQEIAGTNEAVLSREQTLRRKMEQLERIKSALEKLQVDQAEVKAEIRQLRQSFTEQHALELSEYEDRMYEIAPSLKELRSLLAALREELKTLGQVNLMAPEEFTEVAERYQFLSGQLKDLEKASQDLQRVTREIHSESAERFLESFTQIKKNFHILFRRLFGGGRAELKLSDPAKVLESGIDILAQPPGKKLENIALLSGGEKSMTAIALLFAIYMVKPSPFCVLDEIDAALDEQNVIRFVNLLQEFANNSQFIIITHNKKTVACADTLLGVTMEESGVSKIVSLRLEKKFAQKSSA